MHNNNMHFLLVTFPAQGHINPGLQLAKRLIDIGVQVTFSTTVSATRSMVTKSGNLPDGLSLAPFSDGYDDGSKPTGLVSHFMSEFKRLGSKNLTKLLLDLANEGRPVTTIIYSLFLPWVTQLASNFHIPSTLLWIQPAMVFDIYYYYFQGHYRDALSGIKDDVSDLINLPGLPPLTGRDIPSLLLPSSPNQSSFFLELLEEQFKLLEEEREKIKSPLTVLVNTFEALEGEALTAVDRYKLTGVGPLVPSAFLDCKSPSDKSFGGTTSKEDYIEWLNTKEESSVVYVSFGTITVIAKKQMEEIARALVDSGKSFLWVIRKDGSDGDKEKQDMILDILSKQTQPGLIVPWCSQVEVLTHPSVGCFVTHCGWNSTLETLVSGVPVVAFPLWADQGTNAKLMEDVSGTGVRVKVNEEDKILECEELRRCLEIVMGNGEKGREMRMNAKKWKDLARKAVEGGGSSDNDLRSFVDELARNAK